ncbi:hypothetical protein BHE74_00001139 [Ensete ventricosum]|nr:hypothetical protein BHE74_00001139 [Ensete ventricosum]RZR86578.1 hypothetical protein BHM03_00013802 [Ensete ventricosum]
MNTVLAAQQFMACRLDASNSVALRLGEKSSIGDSALNELLLLAEASALSSLGEESSKVKRGGERFKRGGGGDGKVVAVIDRSRKLSLWTQEVKV